MIVCICAIAAKICLLLSFPCLALEPNLTVKIFFLSDQREKGFDVWS